MNNTTFKVIMAILITAASFYAAYAAKAVKVSPAPAHRILTLEYKTEAAITNQLHQIRTAKEISKTELTYQIMPSYSINLTRQEQGPNQLYKALLTYPHTQRELLIQGSATAPDQLSFP